jgi:hypothetical protein
MRSDEIHDRILRSLLARQSPLTAGWGYHSGQQATEPTCLALLALRNVSPEPETDGRKSRNRYGSEEIRRALEQFRRRQNSNGSWSAFDGDDEIGCSITALAIITLIQTSTAREQVCSAVDWVLNARGREAHWLWQWKFRVVDNRVKIDPAKFGWNWLPGTTSWVVPTSLAVIALAHARRAGLNTTEDLNQRLELGRAMLMDRMWTSHKGSAGP